MHSNAKAQLAAAGVVLLALLPVPAPLLPPHRLAEAVQSLLGVSWKMAYPPENLTVEQFRRDYGVGNNWRLANEPLRYNLEPKGGMLRGKYRLGNSRVWAGLSYAFAATQVTFDAPPATPGLPAFQCDSNVGGLTPSLTYDTRDNIFTPTRGTYAEAPSRQRLGAAMTDGAKMKTIPS